MLKDWPATEKPREKLLELGAQSLSDAELLAIFLRTGVKGCHVVDLARGLLKHFGSLTAIYRATEDEFCQYKGLGLATYVQLKACLELCKRCLGEELAQQTVLTSSTTTTQFLQSQLRHENREVFAVLLLTNQHQVLAFKKLFWGTINASVVYPRIVLEAIFAHNANAVIFTHNHPSGIAEPSFADKQITERLVTMLKMIDVNVLDHVIIAQHRSFSFAEHGLL